MHSIFFYRSDCALCNRAIAEVAPFFAAIGKPLVLSKLTPNYFFVPGLPALLVRKDVFDTEQEVIVLGSKMIDQLRTLLSAKNQACGQT